MAGSFSPAAEADRMQLEEALADIVLFGSLPQVEEAAACATALVRGEPVNTQPLVEALRADLRVQLGLDPIPEGLMLPHSGPGRLQRAGREGEGRGRGAGGGGAGGGGGGAAAGGLGLGLVVGSESGTARDG